MKKQLLTGVGIGLMIIFSSFHVLSQVRGNPQLNSITPSLPIPNKPSGVLSPELTSLIAKKSSIVNGAETGKAPSATSGLEKLIIIQGDKIAVEVTLRDVRSEEKTELMKLGLKETPGFRRIMSGLVSISDLSQLKQISAVKFVRPVLRPNHGPGLKGNLFQKSGYDYSTKKNLSASAAVKPVISQGDTSLRSYLARKKYNVDGTGVKVGIISDSYNYLGTADEGVKQGELPGVGNPFGFNKPVDVLRELPPFASGIDEGRGMAEIVHDVAPGAELAFHTAYYSQADFARGILDLGNAGCQVIVDDIIYYAEPFFQDGIVAQAVNQVKKKGVAYFSAAGNNGAQSYESPYRPSGAYPLGPLFLEAHNFSAPGDAPRYFMPIFVPDSSVFFPIFQWDEPFYSLGGEGAKADLDFYLFDISGKLVALANYDNTLDGDPWDAFYFYNSTNSNTFFLVIANHTGVNPGRVKYVDFGYSDFYATTPPIPGIYAGTIYGHANAAGAIATGAAPWFQTPAYGVNPPKVEFFSSLGGVPILFNSAGNRIKPLVRPKPEITAPDGGNTSFFPPKIFFGNQDIPIDSDTFPNFFGTSAAAPHAAGVAAIMIEARKGKSYTPDQIKLFLAHYTVDMDNPYTSGFDKGFDYATGTGLIRADAVVGAVNNVSKSKREADNINNPEITNRTRDVEVFPNPSVKDFRVYLNLNNVKNAELSLSAELSLYTIEGKLLYKTIAKAKSTVDLDGSTLKPGIYILKVKQGEFNKTFKLVKQ